MKGSSTHPKILSQRCVQVAAVRWHAEAIQIKVGELGHCIVEAVCNPSFNKIVLKTPYLSTEEASRRTFGQRNC
ncbi:hypothetical protein AEGHOMDF_5010 [Methylobacterium soli]|nr:hypothetical protein AEGHOMDF_5010 [Methylobacterium soli]